MSKQCAECNKEMTVMLEPEGPEICDECWIKYLQDETNRKMGGD